VGHGRNCEQVAIAVVTFDQGDVMEVLRVGDFEAPHSVGMSPFLEVGGGKSI
jgi:hypothetical protein